MPAKHIKSTLASRTAARAAAVALGGAVMLGTAGVAGASTMHYGWEHSKPGDSSSSIEGDNMTGPSSSLVDLSHNNIPIQACNNDVPVNALGVQVPVNHVAGALGLGILGSTGKAATGQDNSCHQASSQQN